MSQHHAYVTVLIIALSAPAVLGQGTVGLTGVWRLDSARSQSVMGARGESVSSPIDAQRLPRTAPGAVSAQDLTITETADTVDVPVATANRLTLPLSGVVMTSLDATGMPLSAQAVKDGAALVIQTTHTMRLPGGATVVLEVVERYMLTTDDELVVEVTRSTGGRSQRTRAVYTRVP